MITMIRFATVILAATALVLETSRSAPPSSPAPLVGYTELQTNLPGGRQANVRTMRAMLVGADGTNSRPIADKLVDQADAWTQFAGWSPDGKTAIVVRGWESPANAKWEEEHKTFRFDKEGWSLDTFLVDVATNKATNVTAVERVSFYNGGLFYWPNDSTKLGFTALIDGTSHPFRMDLDGRNKIDLTSGSKEFTYGFSSSKDGKRIAYHKNYQVYVADADGSHARRVDTGNPFNFAPTWSPDGEWVLFLSGEHYNCHPHVVRADGSELRNLADRGGYRAYRLSDVADFRRQQRRACLVDRRQAGLYTASGEPAVELFAVTRAQSTQLTHSTPGTLHYHPPSPDGLTGNQYRRLPQRSNSSGPGHSICVKLLTRVLGFSDAESASFCPTARTSRRTWNRSGPGCSIWNGIASFRKRSARGWDFCSASPRAGSCCSAASYKSCAASMKEKPTRFSFKCTSLCPPVQRRDIVLLFRNVGIKTTIKQLYENTAARELVRKLADGTSITEPILRTEGTPGFEIINDALGYVAAYLSVTPFERENWLFMVTCEDRQVVRKRCIRCFLIKPQDLERFADLSWCLEHVKVEKPWHAYRVLSLHAIARHWQKEKSLPDQLAGWKSDASAPGLGKAPHHERIRVLSVGLHQGEKPIGDPVTVNWNDLRARVEAVRAIGKT